MASPSITSVNAIYLLTISGLYTAPQQLQEFAADDIFDTGSINPTEVSMGADGVLSGGRVNVAIQQNITLQANSASNTLFDAWYAAQVADGDVYIANGIVRLKSVGKSYALTRGFLTSYAPMADAKKTLQPRRYQITWQSMIPAPI